MSAGVVLKVVTSTGLRSTGGSFSQRLGSVHSGLLILSRVEPTRYAVMVCFGVDRLTDVLLLVPVASVSAGMPSSQDVTRIPRLLRGLSKILL
jgi:hypothetical protein